MSNAEEKDHCLPRRALLIDLDNCPRQLESLPISLENFERIVACYGSQEPKVPLGLVNLLAEAIHRKRLEIVGMERKGKNAADFGLAFQAGKLAASMPADTEFLILSQDSDLDFVADMLHREGRTVSRLDGKNANASEQASIHNWLPDIQSEIQQIAANYWLRILRGNHSGRPGKMPALKNSIRAFLGKQSAYSPDEVVEQLLFLGLIRLDNKGKLSYPTQPYPFGDDNDFDDDELGGFDDDIPF